MIDLNTTYVSTVAGSATTGSTDGIGINARFNNSITLELDQTNTNLYIADKGNNKIRVMNLATTNVSTVAGAGGGSGFNASGFTDAIGINARFNQPVDIVFDSTYSNLYIADYTNNRVRKLNIETQNVTTHYQLQSVSALDVAVNSIVYVRQFNTVNTMSVLTPTVNNYVGINCNAPQYTLDVNGSINASGDITAFSDRRVKTNITTIESGLSLVNALRGVYYSRTDTNEPSLRHMGVIAQEIEQVLPEVVKTDTSERQMKSVAYGNIVAVLIEGIKELSQRLAPVETLISQVSTLQSQNMYLQSTIASFIIR